MGVRHRQSALGAADPFPHALGLSPRTAMDALHVLSLGQWWPAYGSLVAHGISSMVMRTRLYITDFNSSYSSVFNWEGYVLVWTRPSSIAILSSGMQLA